MKVVYLKKLWNFVFGNYLIWSCLLCLNIWIHLLQFKKKPLLWPIMGSRQSLTGPAVPSNPAYINSLPAHLPPSDPPPPLQSSHTMQGAEARRMEQQRGEGSAARRPLLSLPSPALPLWSPHIGSKEQRRGKLRCWRNEDPAHPLPPLRWVDPAAPSSSPPTRW
jgi:hypothetical protein